MIQISGFKNKANFIFFMVMVFAFLQISVMVGVSASPIALANPSSESSVSTSTSDRIVARAFPPNQALQGPLKKCLGRVTENQPCDGQYTPPGGKVAIKMVGRCRGTFCICGPEGYGPW